MNDESAAKPAEAAEKTNGRPFKKGYDPRRWLRGRGKKSADQKKGEEILRAVIWKELSREFDAASGKPLETEETLTALELAVRNEIKKRFNNIAERIAGPVEKKIDVTSGGEAIKGYTLVSPDDWKKEDGNG